MSESKRFLEVTPKDDADAAAAQRLEKFVNWQIATNPEYRAAFEKAIATYEARVWNHIMHGTPLVMPDEEPKP